MGKQILVPDLSFAEMSAEFGDQLPSTVVAAYLLSLNLERARGSLFADQFFHDGENIRVDLLTQLATMLLDISGQPATENMILRFKREDVQSTFWELTYAANMVRAGFQIFPGRKTGEKGSDFDFTAVRPGFPPVACEVTALRGKPINGSRLTARLVDKLDQLPTDTPAFLFCALPDAFSENDLMEAVREAVFNVMLHEKAPTYLTLTYRDRSHSLAYSGWTIRHPECDDTVPDLERLLADYADREAMVVMPRESGRGAFFRMVQWLLDHADKRPSQR